MGQQLHIQQGASKMPALSPLLLRKLGSVSKKHVFIRSVLPVFSDRTDGSDEKTNR